ncbi:MAG: response regulator [Promethearchaeota archaeon]
MENSSITRQLCGFLWIRPSGVPYFKWFSAESLNENWNSNDLFFSGFFSAISSSSEIFFEGDSLKYIEFNNYKIYSDKINAGDLFVVISRNNTPEKIPKKLLNLMINFYIKSEITAKEEFLQDSGKIENQFLQFLSEIDSKNQNTDSDQILISQNRLQSQRENIAHTSNISKRMNKKQQSLKILELEKKLASFTILGRTIGHTLNNVLSTILGNVTLAKLDASNDTDLYQSMNDAEDSCERARNLTSQLLNISKTIQSHTSVGFIDSSSCNDPSPNKNDPIYQKSGHEELIMGKGRVLILDDDFHILETARRMIKRLGYEVETAQDLPTALKIYNQNLQKNDPFNAVILDLSEIGGLGEFGSLVWRKIDPNIKAIISSGFSRDPIFNTYEEFGYSGVLRKPYNLRELGDILRSVISNISHKIPEMVQVA